VNYPEWNARQTEMSLFSDTIFFNEKEELGKLEVVMGYGGAKISCTQYLP